MRPIIAKPLRWSLLAIVLGLAVVLLGILPVNAGFLRGTVENAVRDAIAMDLSIGGPIKVRLGPWPSVTTGGLALGDANDDPLLLVESLRAEIDLAALIGGRIRVLELEAHGIDVDYCSPFPQLPDAESEDDPPPSVALDSLAITAVSIRCGPSPEADPLEIALERVSASALEGASVQVEAAGTFAGMAFDLAATGGELNDLIAATAPFPVTATLVSDAAVVEASGQLLVSEPSVDAQIEIRDADARAIARAFDVEVPELGSLGARGQVRATVETAELSGFTGNLGTTNFEFDSALDMTRDRVAVELVAALDALDLAPFLDSDPVAQEDPDLADDDIDFSDILDSLDVVDADVELTLGELLGLPIDVRTVALQGQASNGVITLQSLTADTIGGRVSLDGGLDSQAECPALQLRLHATDVDLATLGALVPLDEPLGGAVSSVSLESTSCGATLFAHRDSLRADAELGHARISLGGERLPLSVTRLLIDTEPGRRSRLRLVGSLMNERLEATLAAGTLVELLGPDTWPIDLDVGGGGAQLRLNGRARAVPDSMLLDARLALDAPKLGTLSPWTGVAPDAVMPLSASTRLRYDESRFAANDIAVALGESSVAGRVSWDYAHDPDVLTVTIRSDAIDLAEIVAAFPVSTEQAAAARSESPKETSESPRPFVLPPVDIDVELDAVHFDRLDLQDFRLNGRLRNGLIDNAHVSVLVEGEMALRGGVDLDLRQRPARARAELAGDNLDIGRVLHRLEVVDDVRVRADAFDLLVTTDGMTAREMLLHSLLRVDLSGFNWSIGTTDPDTGASAKDAVELALGQVQLTMAPGQPTTWSSQGSIDGMDVELWLRTPSLVETFGDWSELSFLLVGAAGSNVAMISTRIDRPAEERVVAHVSLSGQIVDGQDRDLSSLASPLGDYQLQSDVVVSEGLLELPNASMQMGSSHATGRFKVDTNGPGTRIDLELNASSLQTDDLLYWSGDFRDALGDEPEPAADEAETPDAAGEESSVLALAEDFLGEFRRQNVLNLGITVDELKAGQDLLGEAELRLYVDADNFLLKPVRFGLPGGPVSAEYTASASSGRLDAGLRINADALSYGGLLRLADPDSEARGLLYVDVDIAADVELPPDAVPFDLLFENANGSASVVAWPENIESGVLDLWSANLVFALLPKSEDGQRSRLNCLVSRFDINDGVMKSRATLLDTTDTIIRGRGTIDLGQEQLDLTVWPQAKREKFLSVSTPIAVTGTFDDFEIGVVPAGFVGMIIRWYTSLIYVPFKWLTGERFPSNGTSTCFDAMDWELTPELRAYFRERDFSAPPSLVQ